ncbi:hypothetical protein KCMC57_up14180 [Kitasatospora sp. CMC57]|uniref:Transposase n=1 Tax=Kitasatospora sp. CMC57 TaxID=3231513 RepID=A0AB33JUB3_9ACTN
MRVRRPADSSGLRAYVITRSLLRKCRGSRRPDTMGDGFVIPGHYQLYTWKDQREYP